MFSLMLPTYDATSRRGWLSVAKNSGLSLRFDSSTSPWLMEKWKSSCRMSSMYSPSTRLSTRAMVPRMPDATLSLMLSVSEMRLRFFFSLPACSCSSWWRFGEVANVGALAMIERLGLAAAPSPAAPSGALVTGGCSGTSSTISALGLFSAAPFFLPFFWPAFRPFFWAFFGSSSALAFFLPKSGMAQDQEDQEQTPEERTARGLDGAQKTLAR